MYSWIIIDLVPIGIIGIGSNSNIARVGGTKSKRRIKANTTLFNLSPSKKMGMVN